MTWLSGNSIDNFHGFVTALPVVGGSIFEVVQSRQSLNRKNIRALKPPCGPAHFRRYPSRINSFKIEIQELGIQSMWKKLTRPWRMSRSAPTSSRCSCAWIWNWRHFIKVGLRLRTGPASSCKAALPEQYLYKRGQETTETVKAFKRKLFFRI